MTKTKTTTSENLGLSAQLEPVSKLESLLREKTSPGRLLNAARAAATALSNETKLSLERMIADLDQAVSRQLSELEADLTDMARSNGWRLEGIWPTFQVQRGLELRVEAAKCIVRVASNPIDATDLEAVAKAVAEGVRDLVPRTFSSHDMLEQLSRSHAALRPEGGQVPILELYGRFVMDSQSQRFWRDVRADRFVAISVDQFRARLSKMLEDGATVARDGRELRLLPPLDPKDALFVYLPTEGRFGYIGRVEFVGAHP